MPDATPPIDFEAHAAFVRRLAWGLLRKDVDADDAAQEALARAIERPPRRGDAIRGWLTAIVRNVVRRRKRTDDRRGRREHIAARGEATASAAGAAAHAEILRRVADALVALDESSREVIVLRHFEGLPPRAVAERLALPVETVKARLKRAHERMRHLLDEGPGGNVEGWRTSLGAFVGFDVAVKAAATAASGTATTAAGAGGAGNAGGAAAATTIGVATGAIAMGTAGKVGLAAALAVAIGATAWAVRPAARETDDALEAVAGRGEPSEATLSVANRPTAASTGAPMSDRAESIARDARPSAGSAAPFAAVPLVSEPTIAEVETAQAATSAPDTLEGVILGAVVGEGWKATLWPDPLFGGAPSQHDPAWHLEVDIGREGRFSFRNLAPGAYEIRVFGPGRFYRIWKMQKVPQTDDGNFRQVVVVGTASLAGRVFDRDGAPVAGRTVELYPAQWQTIGSGRVVTATTDADGSYRFAGLRSGGYAAHAWIGPRPSDFDTRSDGFTLKLGEQKSLDFGSSAPDPTWTGLARLASGAILRPPAVIVLEGTPAGHPVLHVAIGSDGRFVGRVPRGSYRLGVWFKLQSGRLLQGSPWGTDLTISDADLSKDVVVPGVRVSGAVRDASTGRPFPSNSSNPARVRLWPADETMPRPEPAVVMVDADGSFTFEAVPAGRYRFSVQPPVHSTGTSSEIVVTVGDADVGNVTLDLKIE